MGRRSSSGAGTSVVVLIGLIILIGRFISEHLVAVMALAAVGLVGFLVYKYSRSSTATGHQPTPEGRASSPARRIAHRSGSIPGNTRARVSSTTNGDELWISKGSIAETASGVLSDMVYVGTGLRAIGSADVEPALIDPTVPVDRTVTDCTVRRLHYWPSYTEASADARAAYLTWLRSGRSDPAADIGYVFIYFYGLERRALHDARTSPVAAAEVPDIEAEVVRLLGIYGRQRSFHGYARAFLDFLTASRMPNAAYRKPPNPDADSSLSHSHRIALAQCAGDGACLPVDWAYLWVTRSPLATLGTAARRCPNEFRALFREEYRARYGDGLVLPRNRTRLKVEYRPASASFRGAPTLTIEPDLPDVSVLSGPVKKLLEVADAAIEKLNRYSRLIGKNPEAAGSFEALVELPITLWPDDYRRQFEKVRDVVQRAGQPAAVPFEKLRSWMPTFAELSRGKLNALYSALSSVGLGMEPDIRFGGAVPVTDSRVVLFADDAATAVQEASTRYMAASLTLHLAAAVAAADGETVDAERTLLLKQMEEWLSLSESERRRLHAHLRFLLLQPPKLTGLKKRIEALNRPEREAVADFLALVAQADERVTPDEIKMLQKIFRLLGLEPESVFSRVHMAATEPVRVCTADRDDTDGYAIPVSPPTEEPERHSAPTPMLAPSSRSKTKPSREPGVLKLDHQKIDALRKDSERVAAILESVFEVEPSSAQPLPATDDRARQEDMSEQEPAVEIRPGLLGLDAVHSALLQTLLSRTEWARTELEELAEDRDLMLDGALERLNEASFERLDMALFDDGDPVVLNADAVREVLNAAN